MIISLSITRIVFEPKDKIDPINAKPYADAAPEPEPASKAPISESIYGAPAPIDIVGEDVEPDDVSVT